VGREGDQPWRWIQRARGWPDDHELTVTGAIHVRASGSTHPAPSPHPPEQSRGLRSPGSGHVTCTQGPWNP
jgi:hypothetical protein